jgi:NADH dehydrogenase
MRPDTKTKVIIIGGGFGGAYAAQYLEKYARRANLDIHLIDRNNYFTFYPLLVEAGTGHLEPRHTVVSIRRFLKTTQFKMGEVYDIDFTAKKVAYLAPDGLSQHFLEYDHLILALGSQTFLPPVPGLSENVFLIKSMQDAITLRDRAIQKLEEANIEEDPDQRSALLHFVVVGANYTGVEVAGEFEAFIKEASQRYDNVQTEDCKITLIERENRILNAIDSDLAAYAAKKLQKRGVDVRTGQTVSKIFPNSILLDNGETIATHTVVWAAGIAPNALIEKLDIPVDGKGYIECENGVQVKGLENVWAIGDSAVNLGPDGNPYPATAQHAIGGARYVADAIKRKQLNQAQKPFEIISKGALAALGCRTAVAKVFGVKLSGFPAWFLWRTVYLFKMPGFARKFRVALDWTLGLLFKREYVQLGVHQLPAPYLKKTPKAEQVPEWQQS